ncbi:aminopeptidase P family protein [Bacteroidota bacterium]
MKLPSSFFIKSRSKLKEMLPAHSALIMSSNWQMPRNGDTHFPFRQSSDLFYLTGIKYPGVTLLVSKGETDAEICEVLFIPEPNEKHIRWEGPGISADDVAQISGISNIQPEGRIQQVISKVLGNTGSIFFGTPMMHNAVPSVSNEIKIRILFKQQLLSVEEFPLAPLMTKLRMFKEEEEIEMIKKAVEISAEAFSSVLQKVKPELPEYEIEAILAYNISLKGSRSHAFAPIVASGANALTLHYTSNEDVCKGGELLLLDFGAEWEYYAADISRTIPVDGKYTNRQRDLYDAVLRVLKASIKLMQPGITLRELNAQVGTMWEEEHVKLNLYTPEDVRKQTANLPLWKKYSWHGISHSIGLDVHDPFEVDVKLQSGMVLSCEPGIYIENEGIGIRLEEDILITEEAPVNLTDKIPIDPDEIESLME